MDDDDFEDDFRDPIVGSPVVRNVSIPAGHCLVNVKWKNSPMARNISRLMTVKYMDGMGASDFQPCSNLSVVFLGEGDAICDPQTTLATKLNKLKKGGSKVICLFMRTALTAQYLMEVQRLVVLQYKYSVVPIGNSEQVPQLLQQMCKADRQRTNPFNKPIVTPSAVHRDLLLTVAKIPGMGEVRARKLLAKFDSIKKIARARNSDLVPVLGQNLAKGVEDFFRKRNTL